MKRNFAIGVLGGLVGSVLVLILLSAAGSVGARDMEVARSDVSRVSAVSATTPLTTAFTYQGQLKNSGSPVTGVCDFSFAMYDNPTAGTQVGPTVLANSVSITNGLFTAPIDFGSDRFNGDGRWLRISVRCPSGSGFYTNLPPRQPLTAAPYAFALPGLFTQQNVTSTNVVGGNSSNTVNPGVYGATIGGGGQSYLSYINRVSDNFGTVSGGAMNQAGNNAGTIKDREYATVGGGFGNTASGTGATIGGGGSNTASGDRATVGGGAGNTASGLDSTVPGGGQAYASHYGEMAYASGRFATTGDAQTSVYVLRNTTGGATPTELFLDGVNQRITLASNRTLTFDILITGRSSTGLSAGYQVRGVIENVGGVTALVVGISKSNLGEDDAAWDVDVQADNTNDALVVKVTGTFPVDIRWVATVRTVEVGY